MHNQPSASYILCIIMQLVIMQVFTSGTYSISVKCNHTHVTEQLPIHLCGYWTYSSNALSLFPEDFMHVRISYRPYQV